MRERIRDLKREMVIERASICFERDGFEAATMGEIAKSCGMSIGALYKLFDSKEALFYAYVEFQINRLFETIMEESRQVEGAKERLQIVVEQIFAAFCEKSRIVLDPVAGDPLFFTKLSLNRNNPAQRLYDYTASLFGELATQRAMKGENPMQISYLFHQFLLGYVEYWLQFGGRLREESETALDIFLNGVYR